MSIVVFAGTFDPVTKGHVSIIRRALRINSTMNVHVLVANNIAKKTLFSADERYQMVYDEINTDNFTAYEIYKVKVVRFDGLIVDYAKREHAAALVRGVHGAGDYEHEAALATINKNLSGIDTFILPTDPELLTVSSSVVKELARFGAPIDNMVSDKVAKKVRERLQEIGSK